MKKAAAIKLLIASGMILSFSGMADAAGNSDPIQSKIVICQGCHGIEGYRTAYPEVYHVPKLGGQHLPYLVKALKDYRSGERNHPTMAAIASTLSDEDIDTLAAYYADN